MTEARAVSGGLVLGFLRIPKNDGLVSTRCGIHCDGTLTKAMELLPTRTKMLEVEGG